MFYFIYFNGSFYYVSQDAHYKHGRAVTVEYSETDARQACDALNAMRDERLAHA